MAQQKLTIAEWRRSTGLQTWELAEEAGVSKGFVKESEHYDVPVARVKVDKVLEVLSKHHGRPITIADVKDLKVI